MIRGARLRPSGADGAALSLETERLLLTPLNAGALQAWVDGDGRRLRALTGAAFPERAAAPPLFAEELASYRDRMLETPQELGWWVWLVRRRSDARPVGVLGLSGRPVDGGTSVGYAVYPEEEGCGYATEACRALVAWALAQPGAYRVDALVPVGHERSAAVARRAGMRLVRSEVDPEAGEVWRYRVERA